MLSGGDKLGQPEVVNSGVSGLHLQTLTVHEAEEEKTPHIITPAIESTLFDRKRIIQYTQRLELAKARGRDGDFGTARVILFELIKQNPNYPEAFIELADSFSKTKLHGMAIEYYNQALKIAPFDVLTQTKYVMERDKSVKGAIVKSDELSSLAEAGKESKYKERLFKSWYHSRLHFRFVELGINPTSKLTSTKPTKLDFQDITLSNGAVIETFHGMQALEHSKFELAEYYFERAIIKFEHDFISWGGRVYLILLTESFTGDELAEVTKVIEKYHYSLAYFTRFMMHYDADKDALAYQDLVAFLCDADLLEFERLENYNRSITDFINCFSGPDGKVITACDDVDIAADELKKATFEIVNNQFNGDVDRLIRLINTLISRFPSMPTNYATRAIFYEQKRDWLQVNVNYSLAIWLCDISRLTVNFYHRAKTYLEMGKVHKANQDFERALFYLREIKKSDFFTQELKALHDFAELCLKIGKKHIEEGRLECGEAVLELGIERKFQAIDYAKEGILSSEEVDYTVTLNLYLESIKVLELMKKTNEFIRDYTFKALNHFTYWDDKSRTALRAKYDFYQRKIERTRRQEESPFVLLPAQEKKPSATKKPEKHHTFFKSTPAKPKVGIHNIRYDSSEVDLSGFAEIKIVESKDIKTENPQEIEQRKQQKKQREKEKKRLRLQKRKLNQPEDEQSSDSDDTQVLPQTITTSKVDDIKEVKLTDFEIKIFNMIMEVVPEEIRKNYKVFLGGGWAYDKIRLKMLGLPINKYNDFDTVTNIPSEYLEKVFKPVPEVQGLHMLKVGDIKIDVRYESVLDNLARIAKGRDFLSLFIGSDGKVHDPNGFGLAYMRAQRLYSSLPPAEIFKEDYLRIFRSIYTVTKRQLHFSTIKKQVSIDMVLLVPRLVDQETGEVEKLLHPYRFNNWMGRIFSQHMAVKNFGLLVEFHMLEILFPHIQQELHADIDWVKNQMLISNNIPFPKITLIYSSFIACAVAQRVAVTYSKDCKIHRTDQLMKAVSKIYKGSLLFKEAFKDVQELLTVLNRSLIEWKVQHEPTPPEQELDEHQANRLTR